MNKLKVPRYIQWIIITGIIFLSLMSLLRLALVLTFRSSTHPVTQLGDAFFLGFRYDLRIVCIVSVVLFIFGTVKYLHPLDKKWGKRISLWIWVLFIIIFALFYVVDFANYAYLSQRLTATILNYLQDLRISVGMIWQTYHVIWILLGILFIVTGLLAAVKGVYNHVLSKPKAATKKTKISWGILFFLLLAFGIFGRLGQYPLRWSDAFEFGDEYKANVALNPFQSFFSSLEFRSSTYDEQRVKNAYHFMSNYLGVDKPDSINLNFTRKILPDSIPAIGLQRPNVVLVICESFSGYKSSVFGNPLNTTPFFDQLCENGIFFDRYFTPTYGTARGIWASITGIPDVLLENTSSRNPLTVSQHTIMNFFKAYEKFYFIGGSTSWANIRGMLTENIDGLHLYEQDDFGAPKIDVWGISDKNLFLGANKILAKQRPPFFAVIQTADNHRPYTIPEADLSEFKEKDVPEDTLKKYGFEDLKEYNAFRYTDHCYKKFFEAASKENYFKNTIFVFTGDHGIIGDAGNMFPRAWTTQRLVMEHVPFLIYAPAFLKPQRYSFPASQVDIMPTIAGICNIPATNTTLGRNLLDAERLAKDSGKSNSSFIIDIDYKRIGIIHNDLYYSYGLDDSSPEQICSIAENSKIALTDSLRNYYRSMTDAFYETARYMLYNNKRK